MTIFPFLPVVCKGIESIFLRCFIWQADVTTGDAVATSPLNARLTHGHRPSFFVKNVDSVVGCRFSNRQGLARLMEVHGVNNCSLRRTTAVVISRMGSP